MISAFVDGGEKKRYLEPSVEFLIVDSDEDVICFSQEKNDNDFDAGDFGDL